MGRLPRILAAISIAAVIAPRAASAQVHDKLGSPSPVARSAVSKLPTIETFKLANGLRVAVLPSDAAPVVAVQLWYHAGSKDEPRDRRGAAHTTRTSAVTSSDG